MSLGRDASKIGPERKEEVTTTFEHPTQTVRVHDSPHELRIEVTLPEGEPHVLVATRGRDLEIRVFRPLEPVVPWHASPDSTPV